MIGKNFKSLCLAFFIIMSMNAFADTVVTIGNLKYQLNGTVAYVAGYVGSPTNVTIPATIQSDGLTFNVTWINKDAFRNCSSIKTLKAEGNNFWGINDYAFSGCTNLQEINLPQVGCIRPYAFDGCVNLKKVNLGTRLKYIGLRSFRNCSMLSYIVIPASFDTLIDTGGTNWSINNDNFVTDYRPFYGCSRLQAIIYLGTQTGKYGSNATVYNVNNMVSWSTHSFTYTGQKPTVTLTNNLPAGFQPSWTSTVLPWLEVGEYNGTAYITFSNDDMSFDADIPYNCVIYPITLTARVINATKVYGDANPLFETEYSGFVNGEDASVITSHGNYSTSASIGSQVGNYTVSQSGATAQNYTFRYESGTLTITKAPLTMTARDKSMTYGNQLPTFEADYAGLKNNESKPQWTTAPTISTTATSASNAGTYPITITGGVAKNYDVTFKSGTLTINKATLSATTKDASREYGEENPDFELTYSGLKNGDTAPEWTVAPTFATPATKTSPVGTYSITVTGGEAKNYTLQYYNTGKLSVTKAPLTATARSYTRKQGEENPVFAVDYTGFKNGENKLALTQEPIATTTATKNSRPGTYPITVSGGVAMNYEFIYVNGTLTILPEGETEADTENFLTVNSITANKGSQVVMPIAMTNQKAITGLQFDLYLPAGVTIATKSNGKAMIETTGRMDGNYSVTSEQMDGFVRILGYSADGDAFTGNSGDILKVTLNVGNTVNDGNYTIRLKDIVLSDVNNTEHHPADAGATLSVLSYTMGDVDNSGAININDVVCIINHILNRPVGTFIAEAADVDGNGTININDVVTLINRYILMRPAPAHENLRAPRAAVTDDNYLHLATIDINPGETKEVELLMTNANAVAAVQGNIKLPAGLSFVTKANGKVDAKNIDARSEDFTLSCAIQDDGSMTFAHYSADGFNYMGNNGGIFSFKIKADENAQPGSYNVNLTGVVLSIDGVGYDIPDRNSTLNITGSSGVAPIDNGELRIDNYYTLDGQKVVGTPTKKGVYIVNGRKVVVK